MNETMIKEMLLEDLEKCGYMYTLGILKGLYAAGTINVVEWSTLSMWLADAHMGALNE